MRVRRRQMDTISSIFVPVHRYRCGSFSCQWEGNLPANNDSKVSEILLLRRHNRQPKPPASFVVSVAFVIVGSLVVLGAGVFDLFLDHHLDTNVPSAIEVNTAEKLNVPGYKRPPTQVNTPQRKATTTSPPASR